MTDVKTFKAPVVFAKESSISYTVGQDIELVCLYNESFPAVIQTRWYKSFVVLPTTDRTVESWNGTVLTLRIIGAELTDIGNYSCEVETLLIKMHDTLIIKGLPMDMTSKLTVTATDSTENMADMTQSTVSVPTCITKSLTSEETNLLTGQAMSGEITVHATESGTATIVQSTSRDASTTRQLSEGLNTNTTSQSAIAIPTWLIVHNQSIIKVSKSQDIKLLCNVDANLNIKFLFWTKTINGVYFDIPSTSHVGTINSTDLVLHDVKWSDAGLYTCNFGNGTSNTTGNPIELFVDTGTPVCPCTVEYLKKLLVSDSQNWSSKTKEELRIILQPVLNEYRQILQVNPKEMSSYQRRLTSATNMQDSAKRIGYIGSVFLAAVIGLVVFVDLSCIQQHIDTVRRIRHTISPQA